MQRIQFQISDVNAKWIKSMEAKGINRSSLINLAIDVLKPKCGNIGATDTSIITAIINAVKDENRPY